MIKENLINFGGIPEENSSLENSKIVVLPIPYDGTSTWVKGSDKGPNAILDASANMELYDIETDTEVYLEGIYTAPPVTVDNSPEAMVDAAMAESLSYIDKGKFLVTIGGEHSVSIAPIQAHAKKYQNLSILQIDAHADLRDSYEGSKNNHASVMARAQDVCPIVQVGIRSMDVGEKDRLNPERVFWAHKITQCDKWMEPAINLLTDNVYLTIDLDGFDPSILPSTGTPEPGGLMWYQTLKFLRKVIEQKNLVGFDVVELCPNPMEKSSDFLAAKLIYKLLSYKFA